MTTKKTIKKEVKSKVVKALVAPKVKKPKFKLISYTLKATIPTGQYANIQPEITVSALTIEAAERAVMPYIETLFAKYRDGGELSPVATPIPLSTVTTKFTTSVPKAQVAPVVPTVPAPAPIVTVAPAIVLTVPFNRAKGAIESCTSLEALGVVESQIEKSEKLIPDEKQQLATLVLLKRKELNGK